jgi:hypothetical protein
VQCVVTCVAEPTATPIASSILSFIATDTAVTCSTALPMIGSSIRPCSMHNTVCNNCDEHHRVRLTAHGSTSQGAQRAQARADAAAQAANTWEHRGSI